MATSFPTSVHIGLFVRSTSAFFCAVLFLFMTGCCHFDPAAAYKLQIELADSPAAFRNGGGLNQENLVIPLKLQNLSNQAILLSGNTPTGQPETNGLHVMVTLVGAAEPLPAILSTNQGLRAGRCLEPFKNADHPFLFDRYDCAVQKLAGAESVMLKQDPDLIRTSFKLYANEALLYVTVKVDWDQVPTDALVKQFPVPLSFSFYYIEHGKKYALSTALEFKAHANLINGRRYDSAFLPTVGGPVTGQFVLQP